MENRSWSRWTTGLLALLLFLFCTGSALAASPSRQPRVLRVAFPQLRGISETDQYGNRVGLLVDYLNEIAQYTNWEYEYVDASSEELILDFLEGKYDLLGGTYYTPGFEEYFAYPDYSTGRSRAVLLCRRDDDSLMSYNLSSLNGKTIGVYQQATEKIRHLKEFLSNNDLNCELRYYTSADMGDDGNLYQQLRSGEVDLLLGNEMETGGEFRVVASFQAQPYYIVTTPGNQEVLDGLNMALAYILESTPDFAEETYNANFPESRATDIQLNREELRYVAEKGEVTVAVVRDWHPLYCTNRSLEYHRGLLPELMEELSAFSGLRFRFVPADTYEESIQMVQEGEADLLGAYMGQETDAFSEGLALTSPYVSMNNIVLKHKSVSYPGAELTCGILSGRTLPADLEVGEVRCFDTIPEMLTAVNRGEVDFIYGVSPALEQEMQNHRYVNIVPVSRGNNNTPVSFAMARPIAPELLTILNKSIANLSSEERSSLLDQNLVSVGYASLPLQELIYAEPVTFLLIFGVALLLLMTGVLLVVRSRVKNSIMQSQLEAAEAKSRAKSEFLSRMSHEIRTPMNAIVGLTDLACMERDVPPEVGRDLQKIRSSSQYLLSLINDILDMSRIENGKLELEQENFSLFSLLDALHGMMEAQAEQKGLTFRERREINHEWLVGDPIRLRQVLTNLLSNAIKFTLADGTVTLQVEEGESDGKTALFRFSVKDTGVGIPPEDQGRIFASFEQLGASSARSMGTGLGLPISSSIVGLMGGELQVKSETGEGSEFYTTLRFPLGVEEAREGPSAREAGPDLKGVRVLLAEDNDLNAEIAQALLATRGIHVRRAADGQEAVDLFAASAPGEYQLILMDIRMPVKDGQEAAREIRSSGRPDAGVPIIAMTANSFREDEEAARAAGMSGFVPKPVESDLLFAVMRENLR